jgi:hypothetical protein
VDVLGEVKRKGGREGEKEKKTSKAVVNTKKAFPA